jgi:hypothetical protein
VDSLISALDDHTGDVQLMKRHSGWTSPALGMAAITDDRENSPLMSMVPGPMPTGLPSPTIICENCVVSITSEAVPSGPSLHTKTLKVHVLLFFRATYPIIFFHGITYSTTCKDLVILMIGI